MCSNLDRQNYTKKLINGRGKNVAEQRTHRRQRLVERFKALRVQAFDSFRKLKENELTYEILSELKKQILATLDQKELLEAEELAEFFTDLEEELEVIKQQENEYHEKLYVEELNCLTNNLMNKCDLCDDFIVHTGICESCAQNHLTSLF